jgi:two-component system cell cycle sensor histidine kinase/response regulator CckA
LRILHLEDNLRDAELVAALLEAEGLRCEITRVASGPDFTTALNPGSFDLIISDYTLPGYDGRTALAAARTTCPETPYIFVSGTLGEEAAIESLQSGATDYVLKNRLERLVPSVQRALREAQERSEHRQTEEKLREQAEVLDKAHDAILICNLHQQIVYWNAGAARLYGWSFDEARGQAMPELLGTETWQLQEAGKLLEQTGEWSGEMQQVTRTGKRVVVESHCTLMRDDKGKPKSVLIINNDITEHKQIEAQLLRTQRMESIGALAGGIAHDLNNVLTPILISVDLLRDRRAADAGSLLDSIQASARRGADMVMQLLSFARGAESEQVLIHMKHVIAEQEKIIRETFPCAIRVETHIAPDLWVIRGNPTQLYQVLMNLCVNARDAMPDGGRLRVTAENFHIDEAFARMRPDSRPGPYVVVSVSDTGIGIPRSVIDRIFDPFFTTKEAGKGTGLGLSTVLAIVKNHSGFITVYSEPERGTQFKIFFPSAEVSARMPAGDPEGELPQGGGACVLVVEDDLIVREITKAMLEANGYRVLTVSDGTQALSLYAQKQAEIDLVISDISMPFLDGPATIRALRNMNPRLKVIAVSGIADAPKSLELREGEELLFLQKPYTCGRLLRCMDRLRRTPERP